MAFISRVDESDEMDDVPEESYISSSPVSSQAVQGKDKEAVCKSKKEKVSVSDLSFLVPVLIEIHV